MNQVALGQAPRGEPVIHQVEGAQDDAIRDYLVYRPAESVGDGPFPVLLYLHGRGEARVNQGKYQGVDALLRHGSPPRRCQEEGWKYPFILVAPQLPTRDSRWHTKANVTAVEEILASVIGQYQGDENRVYATGFSIGGLGVIALAAQGQRRYRALLPVDAYDPLPVWENRKVVNQEAQGTPTWALSSAENTQASALVTVLDPQAKQTVVPVEGATPAERHTAVSRAAYGNPAVYEWLLAHSDA